MRDAWLDVENVLEAKKGYIIELTQQLSCEACHSVTSITFPCAKQHHKFVDILSFFGVMAAFFMRIVLNFRALPILAIFIWSLFSESFVCAAQSDVDCLRIIRSYLEDPNGFLTTWNFSNKSEGFICTFTGIECWHPDENRVMKIRLGNMGLEGTFPLGVAGCSSMTDLDLSNNKIYGNIPNNISKIVNYLTSLDLSNNELSGEIPLDLANCKYLNALKLDNNQLTGQIPAQIALLSRIKTFSVSNNRLNGPVPTFSKNANITAENYANNAGLCGDPLPACQGASKKTKIAPIVGAAAGGVTLGALGLFICASMLERRRKEIL
ncbi:putative inactive leucine-rich repeat receptor-like protein kinase [Forsythia ovata]|uniref:Inactive leucine-rich repeat receptor-like protein kinase n=1 Tax=Forsythia ovata TaxID=205694 RepID=A0ABD1RKA7_9LAMI